MTTAEVKAALQQGANTASEFQRTQTAMSQDATTIYTTASVAHEGVRKLTGCLAGMETLLGERIGVQQRAAQDMDSATGLVMATAQGTYRLDTTISLFQIAGAANDDFVAAMKGLKERFPDYRQRLATVQEFLGEIASVASGLARESEAAAGTSAIAAEAAIQYTTIL
jgi:hypothetical protein